MSDHCCVKKEIALKLANSRDTGNKRVDIHRIQSMSQRQEVNRYIMKYRLKTYGFMQEPLIQTDVLQMSDLREHEFSHTLNFVLGTNKFTVVQTCRTSPVLLFNCDGLFSLMSSASQINGIKMWKLYWLLSKSLQHKFITETRVDCWGHKWGWRLCSLGLLPWF